MRNRLIKVALKVLSNGRACAVGITNLHSQFRPVPVPWYRAVAMFLVCHNMYNVDAPRSPSAHTVNSAGRRFTTRARS